MPQTGRMLPPSPTGHLVLQIPERASIFFEERGHVSVGQVGHGFNLQLLFPSANQNIMERYKATSKNTISIPLPEVIDFELVACEMGHEWDKGRCLC